MNDKVEDYKDMIRGYKWHLEQKDKEIAELKNKNNIIKCRTLMEEMETIVKLEDEIQALRDENVRLKEANKFIGGQSYETGTPQIEKESE